MLTPKGRESLNDMIVEDIKFVTGKEKFYFVFALAFPDKKKVLNLISNIPPEDGLKSFIAMIYAAVNSVPDDELNAHRCGDANIIIKKEN